ncbi:MAG: MlaD family protein [Gammaproteobacteria bacterium]|nr:MlaD family protein [Gammaproteobacteria bacterium]
MDTKGHYTIVGLMVVFLGAALIATVLSMEAPVRFNGVTVGYVTEMDLNPKNAQEVIVTLAIKEGSPITTSTIATLTSQGITGIAYIDLSAKTPNAPLMKTREYPPYPVIPSVPSLMVQLSSIVKDASVQFHGVAESMQSVLDAQNAANIKQILINLNVIAQSLATNETQFNQMIQSSAKLINNAAVASQQLPELLKNLNQSAISLNQAAGLARAGMIPAVSLLNHLDTISGNVEVFSEELKNNPAILVRGKAEGPLGPGEEN